MRMAFDRAEQLVVFLRSAPSSRRPLRRPRPWPAETTWRSSTAATSSAATPARGHAANRTTWYGRS